ncbi:MAG TPA: hypothetical protein DD413_01875 [Ruminococcus sp.]|nr:hypothetical protein [Ruminococcus sp.]
MKIIKIFLSVILILLPLGIMTACDSPKKIFSNVDTPKSIATEDEVNPTQSADAVADSKNVNGKLYTITLNGFTAQYNSIMMDTGGIDYLYKENWQKKGDIQKDANGIEYELYYYDEEIFTITVSVEVESGMIMNVGCGTTMNTFVKFDENEKPNSDRILHASAVMAAAAAGFNQNSLNVLQDIFYRTTFDEINELWYEGNVFSLTTKNDKNNSENDTMLLRVFPISDELKNEWKIQSYDEYIAGISMQ